MRSIASRYGAGPGHFVGHVLLFLLFAWAFSHVLDMSGVMDWIVWFVGAALIHDLIALPLYTALDRGLVAGLRARRAPREAPAVRLVNHVRVPLVLAGVLLLVSFPLVLSRAPGNFENVAGFAPSGYGTAYLATVAILVVASAVLYVVRRVRSAGGGGTAGGAPGRGEPDGEGLPD